MYIYSYEYHIYISIISIISIYMYIYSYLIILITAKANWGPSTEAQCFDLTRCLIYRLNVQENHIKHYRPIILLLSGNPSARQALVDMANCITKKHGLLYLSHVTKGRFPLKIRENIISNQRIWLRAEKIKAFYMLEDGEFISDCIKGMMQAWFYLFFFSSSFSHNNNNIINYNNNNYLSTKCMHLYASLNFLIIMYKIMIT